MNLLDLANESNLHPKRVSSTKGGEYHSPCPACGGKDRFILWPLDNRYWCRQCDTKGDAIQFCRDFLEMDYFAACKKTGLAPKELTQFSFQPSIKIRFSPKIASLPSETWQTKASDFALRCHQQLFKNPNILQNFYDRGFSIETIRKFLLGWNNSQEFFSFADWDMPNVLKENGQEKKLWLPEGIVIPYIHEKVIKLKIRRSDWKKEDLLPKYVEISGSMKCSSIYGSNSKGAIIVESELDAMLIQQYASDICSCIAIGGAGKKPDMSCDRFLHSLTTILFALDFDQAGKKAFRFWKTNYPTLRAWPVPVGKSPGDALKLGVDLRKWISIGLR